MPEQNTPQSVPTPAVIQPSTAAPVGSETPPAGAPVTFDSWYATQPAEVRGMVDGHISGLKTALVSERNERSKFEKDLRDAAKKLEQGRELQSQLTGMADKLSEASTRADFYEAAHASGVSNLKLAYLVATQDDLINKQGRVDFDAMRKTYPELFNPAQKALVGNAGAGTNPPAKPFDMNDFIRRAAGHQP